MIVIVIKTKGNKPRKCFDKTIVLDKDGYDVLHAALENGDPQTMHEILDDELFAWGR